MRWRMLLAMTIVLGMVSTCCTTVSDQHPGDLAFADGLYQEAIAAYHGRAGAEADRLSPEQRLRLVLARAAGQRPNDLRAARRMAGRLAASGEGDGTAAALLVLLDRLQREIDLAAALANQQRLLAARLRASQAQAERRLARYDDELRGQSSRLRQEIDELTSALARSRQRLQDQSARCRLLQEQLDQLKQIDLAGHE